MAEIPVGLLLATESGAAAKREKKQALDYAPVAVAVLGQAQRLYLLNDSIDLENPL